MTSFTVTNPGSGFAVGQIVGPRPSVNGSGAAAVASAVGIRPSGSVGGGVGGSVGGGAGFGSAGFTGGTANPDDGKDSSTNPPMPVTNPTGQAGATPGAVAIPPNICSGAAIYGWFDENGVINITNNPLNVPSLVLTNPDIGKQFSSTVDCGGGVSIILGPFTATSSTPSLANKFTGIVKYSYPITPTSGIGGEVPWTSYGEPAYLGPEVLDGGDIKYPWYTRNSSGALITEYINKYYGGGTSGVEVEFQNGNTTSGLIVADVRDASTDAVIYTYPT